MQLTQKEKTILDLALNYDSLESQLSDNYSNCDLASCWDEFGKHETAGILGSLEKKGFAYLEDVEEALERNGCTKSHALKQGYQTVYVTEAGWEAYFNKPVKKETATMPHPDKSKSIKKSTKKVEVEIEEVKTCPHCGETKCLEEFHKDKNSKDGRTSWCKVCTKEYMVNYNLRKKAEKEAEEKEAREAEEAKNRKS